MINIIKKKVKKSKYLIILYDKIKNFCYRHLTTDQRLIEKKFYKRLGRNVELENPVKYNDKLQWLKLYWWDPLATKCADKYEVRELIKEKIGEKYLNELISVYESVDEIDISKLPNKFVLKGTHGSGYNIICKNKNDIDWDNAYKIMKRWLENNYYLKNREWVYRDIKPRIICERYLEELDTKELRDYKIFCFNGEPRLIEVDFDRFKNHKRNFYDLDWNFIDGQIKYPNDPTANIKRPEKLNEMIELSRILSAGLPHVRADFYYLNGKIMFGELTFFHESGMGKFDPEEFEITMGNWLELPQKRKMEVI